MRLRTRAAPQAPALAHCGRSTLLAQGGSAAALAAVVAIKPWPWQDGRA
jgi:hypothetical protein